MMIVGSPVLAMSGPRTNRPRASANLGWDDEQIALLTKLHLEGLSASSIAKQLAAKYRVPVTRNAVIGKVHRLGLAWGPRVAKITQHAVSGVRAAKTKRAASLKRAASHGGQPDFARSRVWADPRGAEVRDARPARARDWITRQFGECAFPFVEGATTYSCCARVRPGSPYCAAHIAAMTVPMQHAKDGALNAATRRMHRFDHTLEIAA